MTNGETGTVRTIMTAILAALTATALSACGTERAGPGVPAGPGGEPVVGARWTSCEAHWPRPEAGMGNDDVATLPRLAADFVPVSAVLCDHNVEGQPDGSTATVERERHTGDVDALVTALRLPDQPRTADTCTMDLRHVAWFALLDAQGRWVHPGTPVDTCGKIRMEVLQAVQGLKLTTVTSKVVGEVVSKEAAAAGCSQDYADMIWVSTSQPTPNLRREPMRTNPFASMPEVRLCVYAVPEAERGGPKPGGNFEYGGMLTTARRDAIGAALATAGAPVNCSTPATRFAILFNKESFKLPQVHVELDGCRRVLLEPMSNEPATLAQGNEALVKLLAKE